MRFAIPATVIIGLSAVSCAPEYRYDVPRYTAATSPTGIPHTDTVKSVVVTVHTTSDNKDKDLSWELEVRDTNSGVVYGRTEVGSGDEWRTGNTIEAVVNLTTPFNYVGRKQVQLMVMQKSTSSNDHAWRGAISANAVMADGSVRKLLERSSDFTIGERGNSKALSLSFQ